MKTRIRVTNTDTYFPEYRNWGSWRPIVVDYTSWGYREYYTKDLDKAKSIIDNYIKNEKKLKTSVFYIEYPEE